MALQNDFAYGVTCMSRNCLSALKAVREGKWTLNDMDEWLNAVIKNDATYYDRIKAKVILGKDRFKYQYRGGRRKASGLTPREVQVLGAIGDGLCTKSIALKLHLSPKTVEHHRGALCAIFQTHNPAMLVKLAVGFGLTDGICPLS